MMRPIRKAIPADIPTIVEFQLAMARETESLQLDAETVLRGVSRVLAEPSMGHYWVVEEDGQLIASTLILTEWSDWRAKTVWWIHSLYVRPSHRRRGVWAKLYAHLQDQVKQDPGLAGLRLYVDRTNRPAQDAYRRLGMDGEHYQVFEWMKT